MLRHFWTAASWTATCSVLTWSWFPAAEATLLGLTGPAGKAAPPANLVVVLLHTLGQPRSARSAAATSAQHQVADWAAVPQTSPGGTETAGVRTDLSQGGGTGPTRFETAMDATGGAARGSIAANNLPAEGEVTPAVAGSRTNTLQATPGRAAALPAGGQQAPTTTAAVVATIGSRTTRDTLMPTAEIGRAHV